MDKVSWWGAWACRVIFCVLKRWIKSRWLDFVYVGSRLYLEFKGERPFEQSWMRGGAGGKTPNGLWRNVTKMLKWKRGSRKHATFPELLRLWEKQYTQLMIFEMNKYEPNGRMKT